MRRARRNNGAEQLPAETQSFLPQDTVDYLHQRYCTAHCQWVGSLALSFPSEQVGYDNESDPPPTDNRIFLFINTRQRRPRTGSLRKGGNLSLSAFRRDFPGQCRGQRCPRWRNAFLISHARMNCSSASSTTLAICRFKFDALYSTRPSRCHPIGHVSNRPRGPSRQSVNHSNNTAVKEPEKKAPSVG